MKKILIPISSATIFLSPLICAACSQSQTTGALQWITLKDGDYEHFSPKGEYPTPYTSAEPVSPERVWQLYFEQEPISNMLGNDIIYSQLGVYSTTPEIDMTITPLVISWDESNQTVSYTLNINAQSQGQKHILTILVDNLHYDVLKNKYGIYFGADWLVNDESPYWNLENWQIIIWSDGLKFTIDSVKKWTEWPSAETAANWTAIKPYYCKDIELKE